MSEPRRRSSLLDLFKRKKPADSTPSVISGQSPAPYLNSSTVNSFKDVSKKTTQGPSGMLSAYIPTESGGMLQYTGDVKSGVPARNEQNLSLARSFTCPGVVSTKETFTTQRVIIDGKSTAHGQGALRAATGEVVYEGEFMDGYRHGWGEGIFFRTRDGKMLVKDGTYQGEWKVGLRDGFGIWVSESGDRYEGEWRQGLREGQGVVIFAFGGRLSCQWRNDQKHGCGRFIWPDGKVEDREYQNGELVRVTQLVDSELEECIYSYEDLYSELERQRRVNELEMKEVLDSLKVNIIESEGSLKRRVNELELAIDDEKLRSACQICAVNVRDTAVMPCLHVLYCGLCLSRHQKKTNTCPHCKVQISGTLKLNAVL